MTSCNFKAPNGANSLLYTRLVPLVGEDKAAQIWNMTKSEQFQRDYEPTLDQNGEPTVSWVLNNLKPRPKLLPEVQYQFTAANKILANLDKIQRWEKDVQNPPVLWTKIQRDLGIPKAQVDLIEASEGSTVEEKLTSFLANYSYIVEIETATKLVSLDIVESEYKGRQRWSVVDVFTRMPLKHYNTETEAEQYIMAQLEAPAQVYSNLTVPGGINYREHNINTPAIAPSVKGHAQFATINGIGWFRSDDKITDGRLAPAVIEYYEEERKGEWTLAEAEERLNELIRQGYRVHSSDFNSDRKTRRILEVQSDLFQKSRDELYLTNVDDMGDIKFSSPSAEYVISGQTVFITHENGFVEQFSLRDRGGREDENLIRNQIAKYKASKAPSNKGNNFLQLLNTDNNWVTFFVKAIIQDSAKKGYEKVLFPSGNTITKIEGLDNLEQMRAARQDDIDHNRKSIVELQTQLQGLTSDTEYFRLYGVGYRITNRKYYKDDSFGEGSLLEIPKEDWLKALNEHRENVAETIENYKIELEQFERELAQIDNGSMKINPVANFYETIVYNVLKKHGYNPVRITDEYGNDWFEINTQEEHLDPVLFAARPQPKYRIPMNFADGTGGRKMRPEFAGKSTMDLILSGDRTATSRDRSKSYNQQDIKVGDIIEFYDTKGRTVLVEVTRAPYPVSSISAEEWSKLEGWEPGRHKTLVKQGYDQFQFKLYTPGNLSAAKPKIGWDIFGQGTKTTRMEYSEVKKKVQAIYEEAFKNPTIEIDLTAFKAENYKKTNNTGYSPLEIADVFGSMPIPSNVKFDEDFSRLIANSVSYQLRSLNLSEVPFMSYNEHELEENTEDIFVPVRDEAGNKTGARFTSDQQVAAVDAIVAEVWDLFRKGTKTVGGMLNRGATIYTKMEAFRDKFRQARNLPSHMSPEQAAVIADNIQIVLNSWNDIIDRVLYKLKSYGLNVKGKIPDALSSDPAEEIGELQETAGRGLRDWSDSSFELNPKDTASTRIKLFLASMREIEIGTEREPAQAKLSFKDKAVRDRLLGKDPIMGRKTMTIRSKESLDALGLTMDRQYITTVDNVKFRVSFDRVLTGEDLVDPTVQANAAEEGIIPQAGDVVLKLEEWRPRTGVLRPIQNFIGFAQLVDFESLFQEILEVVQGVPNTVESMIQALREEGKTFRPVLIEVANKLQAQPADVQREFVTVMSKQYAEHSILLYTKRRSGFMDMTPINANSGSAVNSIIKQWQENQKHADIITKDDTGNRIINQKVAVQFQEELQDIIDAYESDSYPDVNTTLKPFAKRLFEANGIIMPQEALDHLFSNMTKLTKNTSIAGGIKEQFSFTQDGKPTGMFSALVSSLNGQQEEASLEEQRDYLVNNNPLYTTGIGGEGTTIRLLARLTYRFSPKVAAGMHKNSKGDSIYAFTQHTHLSASVDKLKNDANHRANLATTHLGKHSWLLKRLNESAEEREKFNLQYVDALKQANKRNAKGITRPSMSTREQLLFALGQFQRQGNKTGNFISLTHSDKANTPLFTGITKVFTGKEGIAQNVQDMIYQTVLGEFERIRAWYGDHSTVNDSYNRGGGYFYFLPEMNYDFLNKLVKEGRLSGAELQTVWISKGVPNLAAGVIDFKKVVLKIFEQHWLTPEINKLDQLMEAESFYEEGLVDYGYLVKNMFNVNLALKAEPGQDRVFVDTVTQEVVEHADAIRRFYQWAAKDFLVNYWLMNTAVSSLIFGDPALAFKGKSAVDYKAVEETLNEYQKRLAKDIAPGADLTWENGPTETYKALTIQDNERVHGYLAHLSKYNGVEINGTDAQELTTVREHLYVMRSAGTITDTVYNEMIAIIEAGLSKPDKYYEFEKPEHLDVVMQIMKPVHVSQNFDEIQGTATVHYVKTSAMPLYPPLTKYFQIDALRQAMEGTNADTSIPRANYVSGKKMGVPAGRGAKVFDADGNITIPKDLTPFVQTISRAGFRIQQEVPYDELKESILTGSQSNKIFVEGIDDLSFNFRGTTYTGAEIKAMKENVRMQMIALQHAEFIERTGAVIVGDTLTIHDTSKLLGLLQEEAVSRSYPPNDIAMLTRTVQRMEADGETKTELAIPIFFNPSSSRFESLLMSLVKKIGQIYMPGKSYIQAASAGFKFKDKLNFEDMSAKDKANIVWLPGYDGSELKTMTKDGPAQVLMPFNFIIQGKDGQDETANVMDFVVKGEDGRFLIDYNKIPKELTQHIAFRIPTQKHNSMLPLEVVGFVPQNLGDIIVVPEAITRQMGSDFDVDKLFTYRRPYRYDNRTKTFSVIANQGSKPTLNTLANDYFDIYWTVLTHPQMYETVMEPLDKPDLKNEGIRASTDSSIQNFFSITHQIQDYISQKDAKIMVAISSLFVTFNSLIEGKNLYVGNFLPIEGDPEWEEDTPGEYSAQGQFVPNGVRFIAEDEDQAQEAYHISKKGTTKYYEKDVETRVDESGKLTKVFVDPITGKESPFDSNEAQTRTRIDSQVTFQSAFLDHAKERIIDKLNINLNTVYAAFAATTLVSDKGQRMSEKHIVMLLRQPGVQKLVDTLSRSKDSLSAEFNLNLFEDLLDKQMYQYISLAAAKGDSGAALALSALLVDIKRDDIERFLKSRDADVISVSALKQGLEPQDTAEYYIQQAGALLAFGKLNEIGRGLGSIQRTLGQDPRGPGKDMTVVLDFIGQRSQLSANPIIQNAENLLDSEQGYIHKIELDTARSAYREILPYEGLQATLEAIKELTGRRDLSSDTVKDIVYDYKSYVFTSTKLGLSNNPNEDRYRLLYGIPENNPQGRPAEANLANRVWKAQQTSNNYFLKRLRPQEGNTPNTPSYVFYLASRASALDDQDNIAGFLELLTSKDPETKRLGEDLVRYAYLTGGISGGFSFIQYIPVDFLTALPFAGALREINQQLVEQSDIIDSIFLHQWIRHNPSMVRKVPKGFNEHVGEKLTLPMPSVGFKDPNVRPLINADGAYPNYISHWDADDVQWKLFEKVKGTSNTFVRVDTLGNSFSTEFVHNAPTPRSIFVENNALITPATEGVALDTVVMDSEITNKGEELWETDVTAQLGITQAIYRHSELTALIKSMSRNKKINSANRFMLDWFSDIINVTQRSNPLTLEMRTPVPGSAIAQFLPATGTIAVLDTSLPINEVAGTIVHELGHGVVTSFTRMSVSEQRTHAVAYAKLQEVYKSLDEARKTALEEAAKDGISEERFMELAELLHGNQGYVDSEKEAYWASISYAVSNVDEFLSHVWEHKDFQSFLNLHKSKDGTKTLLSSILDKIVAFLKELRKILGVTIKKDHQLAVSLKRTFEFLNEVSTIGETLQRPQNILKVIANTYYNGVAPVNLTWYHETEEEALRIYDDMKAEFPFVKVMLGIEDDGRFTIQVETNPIYKAAAAVRSPLSSTNPLDRVYSKVQDQIRSIESSIAKNKSTPDILRQRQLLKDLRVLNNDLRATQDLDRIKDLANFQLGWAQKVRDQFLENTRPTSINQIMTAYRLIGVWTNLLNMVYNGVADTSIEYDEEFNQIQGNAQKMQNEFNSRIMKQTLKEISKGNLTDNDLNSIEDSNEATSLFLSLDRSKDKVTQVVSLIIQDTHKAYLEKGQKVVKELREFEEEVRAIASKRGQKVEDFYEQFFQEGSDWGLVSRYTTDFYRWRSNLRKKLTDQIATIEQTHNDDRVRANMIKAAINNYWRALDHKAGFVDVRLYLDESGVELNNETAARYKKLLVDEYGQEFVDDILQEAKEKYQQYVKDKEDIEDMYDSQVENDLMDEDEAEEAKAQWDIDNSPLNKLGSRKGSSAFSNFSDKYLVLVPHKNAKGFDRKTSLFSSKFEKIKNDKELLKVYNRIKNLMDEYTGNLPFYLDAKLGENFLPAIRQHLISDISQAVQYVKNIPAKLVDQLTASSYEEFMHSRTTREIPILYTDNPFEGIEKPGKDADAAAWEEYNSKKAARSKGYSRNLPRLLELFGLMSYHYKYFSDAKDAIDLGEEILKKTDKDMQSGMRQVEKNGRLVTIQASLKNTLGALEYTRDVLMYKRARALEGKTGEIVTKKDKKAEGRLRDLRAEMRELDRKLDNNEITPEEYAKKDEELKNKLANFNIKRIYASKIGDSLITWTQLKALSYNPMSAINNLVFGLISSTVHANGGQDYTWKEFRKAFAIMMNSTGRSLGLARLAGNDSAMHKTAEKILNIMDRMGIMGELVDSEYGQSNINSTKKGIRSVIAPYQMLRTGDYFVKALNMIAILHHDKYTVNGESKPLWELLDQNGNFTIADEKWQSEDPLAQTEWNKIRNKVVAVNKIVMGNQDKSSPIAAKKKILWRLVGQFRLSWFSEGIASRFEDSRYDIQLGRQRKGRYRTYGDLGPVQSISVLSKQLISALPFVTIDPYKGATLKNGEFTELDKANMRRNLTEIGWFLMMLAAAHLIGALASGDDDERRKSMFRFAANMAIRSYQDVALYSNPTVFDQILGTPAPALGTIRDVSKFFSATVKLLADDDYTSEQWFYKLTRAGFIPQTTLINRFKTMTERDLSEISR